MTTHTKRASTHFVFGLKVSLLVLQIYKTDTCLSAWFKYAENKCYFGSSTSRQKIPSIRQYKGHSTLHKLTLDMLE